MINDQVLEEIREIRKLLELLAEPAISQRDAKMRSELRAIVGSSQKKQQSVLLMDGSRTQTQIRAETSLDQGDLSKMISKLLQARLIIDGKKEPKLIIAIPTNFFDTHAK